MRMMFAQITDTKYMINNKKEWSAISRSVFTRVCLSTPGGGGVTLSPSHNTSTGHMTFPGRYPYLHSIILPLVSGSFPWGKPTMTGRGTPIQAKSQVRTGWGVPPDTPSRRGWGTRCPGEDGVTPHLGQNRMEYTPPAPL